MKPLWKLLLMLLLPGGERLGAQWIWIQQQSLPDTAKIDGFCFCANGNGYVSMGGDVNMTRLHSVWEFNTSNNGWQQKQNFMGSARWQGVAFSIGSKGYIGTGQIPTSAFTDDFWSYDPASDTWSQLANVPGGVRNNAISFSIGSKGYVGLGQGYSGYLDDLWEYDTLANLWSQKSSFPPGPRCFAVGLSIGTEGFAGLGRDNAQSAPTDFWKFDPASDSWIQVSDFPGGNREEMDGLHCGDSTGGFIGTGRIGANLNWTYFNDIWRYVPANDSWTQIPSLPAPPRIGAIAFSSNGRSFFGMGYNGSNSALTDLWELKSVPTGMETENDLVHNLYWDNGVLYVNDRIGNSGDELLVMDISGKIILRQPIKNQSESIQLNIPSTGVYPVAILKNGKPVFCRKIVVVKQEN